MCTLTILTGIISQLGHMLLCFASKSRFRVVFKSRVLIFLTVVLTPNFNRRGACVSGCRRSRLAGMTCFVRRLLSPTGAYGNCGRLVSMQNRSMIPAKPSQQNYNSGGAISMVNTCSYCGIGQVHSVLAVVHSPSYLTSFFFRATVINEVEFRALR